jgi:hypothetical protein
MTDNNDLNNKAESTPKDSRPWYKKKAIVIPLVLVVLIIGAGSNSDSEESGTATETSSAEIPSSNSTTEAPAEAEPTGGEFGNYPPDQAAFVKVIEEAKEAIGAAETDLQESVALRARDKKLCALLTGNKATNWTGIVDNVGANGEGKAYVYVEIAEKVKVITWNNSFSDISADTLIPTSSKFFDKLVAMQKGDLVTFSATLLKNSNSCLKKGNLTEYFYGERPEFVAKFSDITKN